MSLLIFSMSCRSTVSTASTASNDDVSNMALTSNICTGTLVEGANTSCSFDLALDTEPTGTVRVAFSLSPSDTRIPALSNITFDTSTWNTSQKVTVTINNDAIDQTSDPNIIIMANASSGGYDSVSASLPAFTLQNDDVSNMALASNTCTGTLVEGTNTSCSFNVALDTEPTGTVTMAFSLSPSDTRIPDLSDITFDASNWSTPQIITVNINNDAISQTPDPNITIMANASGGGYGSVSASLPAFTLQDDDLFYLHANGVTIVCTRAAVGDTGTVNSVTYTKRDLAGLKSRISSNIADVVTTCTSGITNMSNLFMNKSTFNEDISHWDTSQVLDMNNMFNGASVFNKNIGSWNTSQVMDMNKMFLAAVKFNQDIGGWNTGEVKDMTRMFRLAADFNRDLRGWCVTGLGMSMAPTDFAASSGLSAGHYPQWGTCPP